METSLTLQYNFGSLTMPSGKEGFSWIPIKDVTHLTSEERRIIETGIRNGSTKTAIVRTIGKDNTTVGKEIKLHRKLMCAVR